MMNMIPLGLDAGNPARYAHIYMYSSRHISTEPSCYPASGSVLFDKCWMSGTNMSASLADVA